MKALGDSVVGIRGDVSKLQDLDSLYWTVKAKGKIDVLVANAGTATRPLGKPHGAAFRQALRSQREGHLVHVEKASTLMNDGGSIFSSAPSRASKARLPSVPTAQPRPQFAIWCEPGRWS